MSATILCLTLFPFFLACFCFFGFGLSLLRFSVKYASFSPPESPLLGFCWSLAARMRTLRRGGLQRLSVSSRVRAYMRVFTALRRGAGGRGGERRVSPVLAHGAMVRDEGHRVWPENSIQSSRLCPREKRNRRFLFLPPKVKRLLDGRDFHLPILGLNLTLRFTFAVISLALNL